MRRPVETAGKKPPSVTYGTAIAIILLTIAVPGSAQDDNDWTLTEYRLRFSFMHQDGRGYQSQAGPAEGPGSEHLLVFQPLALFRIRQNERASHEITVPVDIVSSASADALDAVSQASRQNEAGGLDIVSTWAPDGDNQVSARYGFHLEEPLRTFFFGFGYSRSLADRNATLAINGNAILDFFDPITPRGFDLGYTERLTLNSNVSLSQMLSPTTLGSITYGLTFQTGTLETTWNATPQPGEDRGLAELFPNTRVRHAVAGFLAQHIPTTRSTVRAHYRYYRDDIGVSAHTARLEWYQYLGSRFLVRGHYRFHHQDGAAFFITEASPDFDENAPRTSDSDLSPFIAHEYGARLIFYFSPSERSESTDRFDLDYLFYHRTNDLRVHMVGISYGRAL